MGWSKWSGHVAAITGAGSGIGKAIAERLWMEGASLALADINKESLEKVRAELEEKRPPEAERRISIHVVDVAKEEQVKTYAMDVVREHLKVTMVFNNAGVAALGSFDTQSRETFNWCVDIDLHGVVHGCRYFLPHLKKEKLSFLVNISSMYGYYVSPFNAPYHMAKFAVRGLTEALILESRLNYPNVIVCAVHPGYINTNVAASSRLDGSFGSRTLSKESIQKLFNAVVLTQPSRAAYTILDGLHWRNTRILVGTDAVVLDLLVRIFPRLYMDKYVGPVLVASSFGFSLVAAKIRDLFPMTMVGDRTALLMLCGILYYLRQYIRRR